MSDPFKSPKPRDPKMETIVEDVSAANDGIQKKDSVESQAGLYSGRDGDALALNKDGYVHSDLIVGVQGQQIAHLSYFCPGIKYLLAGVENSIWHLLETALATRPTLFSIVKTYIVHVCRGMDMRFENSVWLPSLGNCVRAPQSLLTAALASLPEN